MHLEHPRFASRVKPPQPGVDSMHPESGYASHDGWADDPSQGHRQSLPDPDHPLVAWVVRAHVRDMPCPHMVMPDCGCRSRSPLLLELVGRALGARAAEI